MKKILCVLSVLGISVVLSGCSNKEKLYILNWQEYISEDLVDAFEDEYDVKVVSKELISNEAMYSELKRGSNFDVVFPSDYMIEKLASEDMLLKLDTSLITNFTDNSMYSDQLDDLIDQCGYDDYFVPYFWGSLGIMYNTRKEGIVETVENYGWEVFFDETVLANNKVAMYNSSRDSYAAAAMYMQTVRDESIKDTSFSINSYTDTQLEKCANLLKNSSYNMWGTDNIKGRIATGNIDIGLVYSGDFFDQLYYDDYEDINYDIFTPQTNNVFYDGMAIPSSSENPELAHKFIDFMMSHDNALENAYEVGYCPTIQSVLTKLLDDEEMNDITKYKAWNPQHITNGTVYIDLKETYVKMENSFLTVK